MHELIILVITRFLLQALLGTSPPAAGPESARTLLNTMISKEAATVSAGPSPLGLLAGKKLDPTKEREVNDLRRACDASKCLLSRRVYARARTHTMRTLSTMHSIEAATVSAGPMPLVYWRINSHTHVHTRIQHARTHELMQNARPRFLKHKQTTTKLKWVVFSHERDTKGV